MNVEPEPNGGTHLGMYNFEEKWKHLVPGGRDDLFDAYMQQSSKQKTSATIDDGLSYFTQVNLMSNSAESIPEMSKVDKKIAEEKGAVIAVKEQFPQNPQHLSFLFKVGIGIIITSCVVLATIVAMSATGNSNMIPNLNKSGSMNQESHVSVGDPTTIPTRSPFAKTNKPTSIPSRPSKQPIGSKPPTTLYPSALPTTVSPTTVPTDVSQTWEFSYLHTSGNQIVDRNLDSVRLSAVNWFGFDSSSNIPQGLWARSYKSILTQMQSLGFNCIRIPFANDMLRNASKTQSISYQANPDLADLSPLQCLDKIIEYSGSISLRVILSRQSCHSDASNRETQWFVSNDLHCSEAQVNADWAMLARRYLGTAVIGFDLWNAPKGLSTWGTGNIATDWNTAAERAGNAVLSANPYLLIFVQGVQNGNDLTGVAKAPIKLNLPGRVVYMTSEYSNDLYDHPYFSDPSFPSNLRAIWNNRFGYIVIQQIAPIMINEFGVSFAFPSDTPWLTAWMKYLNGEYMEDGESFLPSGHVGISWSYQQVAPYGPVGGVLADDWQTVQANKLTFLTPAMGELFSFVNHSIPFIPPPVNKTSVVPNPTYKPTFSPTQFPYEYFHTSGNQIVNREGKPVRLSGVNWLGTESYGMIIQGLWVRNYKSLMYQMRDIGFNTLRIPYSNAMLRPDAVVSGVDFYLNPDLVGLTPLECLIRVVDFAGSIGLRVILDRHSCLVNNYNHEPLWYLPGDEYYTEKRFIDDWVMLAKLFKGTAVLGADLWNEPKMISTWGSGNMSTDWNEAAQRVGNAILEVNSDWLLFIEGIGTKTWWGGNLHGVRKHPIVLNVPNRVVYSVHEYCLDVDKTAPWFHSPTYPDNLRPRWDFYFGFIFQEQIAPIWIGEYGTAFIYDQDYSWMNMWVNYTNGYFRSDEENDLTEGQLGMSWAFWAVSPGGDVGGILKDDWITVEEEKLNIIRRAMAPLIPLETQEQLNAAPSNASYVVPSPTLTPTSQKKPFQYYHTQGSQIVDSLGNPIRWMGINWYGAESVWKAPIALWTRNYRSVLEQIVALGFNLVRLPFANEVLTSYARTEDIDISVNPELEDLTPLQVMDKIIAYAGVIGLQVILDRHSAKVENYANETLWYIADEANYTEETLISDWVMLAQRYKGTAVVGVDLWHEPKNPCTWGSGDLLTDWNLAAERIGNAILAVNPDLLIIVEGIANNTWWGSNLEGVATHPIRLSVPNRVVYSVHEYPNDAASVPGFNLTWFNDPHFPNNLRHRWKKYFGFIVKNNIAPVYIGEFGTSLQDPKDFVWLKMWLRYMNGEFTTDGVSDLAANALGLSWSLWAVSVGDDCAPGHPGGDCIKANFGGILEPDWYTVNEYKFGLLSSVEPLPTNSPSVAPPAYTDYLHTSGNQILDKENKPVRITGINWYGFESRGFVPQGLWVRGYRNLIDQMKSYGFNALRIPFCNEMLLNSSRTSTIIFSNSPDLEGKTPLQCLDAIVQYAGSVGMRIILDRHSAKNENYFNETLWYIAGDRYYTEQTLIKDWVMLANRYKGTAVVGVDLWNEPKHPCTWGSGELLTDWNLAAERIGNAILAVNPNLLVIVEGIANNTWWGSNLEGVATHPIRLNVPNRVVYSVHEYGDDAFNLTWFSSNFFPNNLRSRWNKYFGYIVKQRLAPVYIGEFGTSLKYPRDSQWLSLWIDYINGEFTTDGVNDLLPGENGLSWTFWSVSPGGDCTPGHDGGDCIKAHFGGILESDWRAVNKNKIAYLKAAMVPSCVSNYPTIMPSTVRPTSGRPSSAPVTRAPSPYPTTASPTPPPTAPVLFYMGSYDFTMISRWNYLNDRTIKYKGFSPSGITPSWLAYSPDKRFVYVTNEYVNNVQAFSVNPSTGTLTLINTVPSIGGSPCHISVDPGGRFIAVANYLNGVMTVIAVNASTGALLPSTSDQQVVDSPTSTAHQHCAFIKGQYVTVMEKGQDKISQYPLSSTGLKSNVASIVISTPTGTGPNHIKFHPSGSFAISLNAIGNSLTIIPSDPATGKLLSTNFNFAANTVTTLRAGEDGSTMLAAEVMISPSGQFVYASNRDMANPSRQRSSIAVFQLLLTPSPSLQLLQHVSSRGDYPRYFQLVRNGTNLVLLNQVDNNFVSFLVNPSTGLIDDSSAVITTPTNPALIQPSFTLFQS